MKGLIHRIPKAHRYSATTYGLKIAFIYSKLYLRILRPQWNALLRGQRPTPAILAHRGLITSVRKSRNCNREAALAA